MKFQRYFIVLLFFLFISFNLFSQQNSSVRFTNITVKDGLCGYPVNSIYQDKTGYIWFCTNNGLQRFDGKNFRTFYSDPQNRNSLPNDFVSDIKEDKYGRYWITNVANGGLSIYNPVNETFLRFNSQTNSLFSGDDNSMFFISFTPDGNTAFISSTRGFYKFDVNTLRAKRFLTSNSGLLNNWTGYIIPIRDNFFLLNARGKLQLYDSKYDIFYDNANAPIFKKLLSFPSGEDISFIKKDNKGIYWFGYWLHGLYCYDPASDTVKEIIFDTTDTKENIDKVVVRITEDSAGNLYIGTFHAGIYYFNTHTNKVEAHYTYDPDDSYSLISPSVKTLFYDKQKTLWVGTEEGISKFNKVNNQFSYPILRQNGKNLVPNALLQGKDGHIWIGTYAGEGLFEFDKDFHLLHQYNRFEDTINFIENGIWHLNQTSKGNIMVCRQKGFSLIYPKTGRQNDFAGMPDLSTTATTGAFEDEQKRIWIGCWHSRLVCLDSTYKHVTVFQMPGITHLYAIEKDKLLIRTHDSTYKIFCFDIATKKLYREPYYFFHQNDSSFLYQNPMIRWMKIYDGNLYVSAVSGFYIINKNSGAIKHYTRTNLLPSVDVYAVAKAANGSVWISSPQGLSVIDTLSEIARNYGEAEGLRNLQFQSDDMLQLNNGIMLACDTRNLVAFYPNNMASLPIPPAPVFTALRIGNREVPVSIHNRYHVSYQANTISFDFASLDFVNTRSIKYAYILQGFDTGWNYVNNTTNATYTNLSGGSYTFKVKAANGKGEWNETITALNFSVSTPFYKQQWFFALIAISILFTLYAFYRIRIQRIIEIQQVRNNISRDLHDEVGSTLSSISMLSTTAERSLQKQEAESAKLLVERISNSSQRILEVFDEIIWTVNPRNDSMESILIRIRGFINDIADTKDININMRINESIEKINLPMKLKRNLYLIFKEALNNAANHSSCKTIDISLERKHQFLLLQIKDDGKGFETATEFEGNGLKNMRQRSKEIRGNIHIQSEINNGTLLTLIIPIP